MKKVISGFLLLLLILSFFGCDGGNSTPATDTTPDVFTFEDIFGAQLSTLTESDEITITGIDSAANITIVNGEYQINGGAWNVVAGTTSNGDIIKVRLISSGSYGVKLSATLTIGGISEDFEVTTPIAIPKTGQITSYTSDDDGDLQKGLASHDPRFTDNGDGSVTDNLTSLMWLKNSNCILTEYPVYDNDGRVTWQQALEFVAAINAGAYPNCSAGYNDWRLPNINELTSLLDAEEVGPALPSGYPFTNVENIPYWSSTTSSSDNSYAWNVDMSGGVTTNDFQKTLSLPLVWPVRNAQ